MDADVDRRFHVVNLGCRVNRVEADTVQAALTAAGAVPSDYRTSRVVIVNTCTVTGEATAKARKAVRQALDRAPEAIVIATGCAVSIDADMFESLSDRVMAIPDKSIALIRAHELLDIVPVRTPGFTRGGSAFMTRAGIKVQDGCSNACTYCIVHVARGPLWSKPADEVVDEVLAAQTAGVHELVLTGINLGMYASQGDLCDLIERILSSTSDLRIRLSSIEPPQTDDRLIGLLAASQGRICRHLHLPLQSGSSRILENMGRRYDARTYLELADELSRRIPTISLTTDIIAGFPGETEDDFEQTCDLARTIGFSKIHVFRYSRRPGTPAAARNDQLAPDVINRRADTLRGIADGLRCDYAARCVGRTERLLVERGGRAVSECYLSARIADGFGNVGEGSLVDVRVSGSEDETLVCETLH